MLKNNDGEIVKMTSEEIMEIKRAQEQFEREYWNQPYDDLVNAEIRKRYSASQEFAIIRQQLKKPEEFATYDAYCEECKTLIKTKKGMI